MDIKLNYEIAVNCTEIEMYNLSKELERIIINEPDDDFDQYQETRKLYILLKDNLRQRKNECSVVIKAGNYEDLPTHLQLEIERVKENVNRPIPNVIFGNRENLQQKIKNILLGKLKYSEVVSIPPIDAEPPKKPGKQY